MCSCLLPQLKEYLLGRRVGIPVINNILEFHLSTVPVYQNDLVLHSRMEGERSPNKIIVTDVCLPILDYTGLRVNLVLKNEKMPPMANIYPGALEYRQN